MANYNTRRPVIICEGCGKNWQPRGTNKPERCSNCGKGEVTGDYVDGFWERFSNGIDLAMDCGDGRTLKTFTPNWLEQGRRQERTIHQRERAEKLLREQARRSQQEQERRFKHQQADDMNTKELSWADKLVLLWWGD
jgi:hypothetical protein